MNDPLRTYLGVIGARGGRKTARRGRQYYRDLQRRSVITRRQNAAKAVAARSADAERR